MRYSNPPQFYKTLKEQIPTVSFTFPQKMRILSDTLAIWRYMATAGEPREEVAIRAVFGEDISFLSQCPCCEVAYDMDKLCPKCPLFTKPWNKCYCKDSFFYEKWVRTMYKYAYFSGKVPQETITAAAGSMCKYIQTRIREIYTEEHPKADTCYSLLSSTNPPNSSI